MSTRSSVKIDGINLYSHWDGYPQGMAFKLYQTIENLYDFRRNYFNENRFLNAFIAGNISNCEIDLSYSIWGQEYRYEIEKKHIKAFEVSSENVLIFDGSIFYFIKQYHDNGKHSILIDGMDVFLVQEKNHLNEVVDEYLTTSTREKAIESINEHIKNSCNERVIYLKKRLALIKKAKGLKQ